MNKIKSVSIIAKEWFDKVNGNSYFSAQVDVNFGLEDHCTIYLPLQYGYGNHFETKAAQALSGNENNYTSLWKFCEENNIAFKSHKIEGCLKRDVKAWGTEPQKA